MLQVLEYKVFSTIIVLVEIFISIRISDWLLQLIIILIPNNIGSIRTSLLFLCRFRDIFLIRNFQKVI